TCEGRANPGRPLFVRSVARLSTFDRTFRVFYAPNRPCYPRPHARRAASPPGITSALLTCRGRCQGGALPEVGRRQDVAASGTASPRPAAHPPLSRAVRRRRRPLLRRRPPPRGLERQQRRARALLPPGPRQRSRRPRRARGPCLREGALPKRARSRSAPIVSSRARCPLHLSHP